MEGASRSATGPPRQGLRPAYPSSVARRSTTSVPFAGYHGAVVDARVNDRAAPAGLEPGVTMERHHALNWLIGYMDQAWDEVSTDT